MPVFVCLFSFRGCTYDLRSVRRPINYEVAVLHLLVGRGVCPSVGTRPVHESTQVRALQGFTSGPGFTGPQSVHRSRAGYDRAKGRSQRKRPQKQLGEITLCRHQALQPGGGLGAACLPTMAFMVLETLQLSDAMSFWSDVVVKFLLLRHQHLCSPELLAVCRNAQSSCLSRKNFGERVCGHGQTTCNKRAPPPRHSIQVEKC
jgi:hypothetical protein